MLVLKRRLREKLYLDIGGVAVVVQVVEGGNGQLKLGISAPKAACKVDRAELLSFAEQAAFEERAGHVDPAPPAKK